MSPFAYCLAAICGLACLCDSALIQPSQPSDANPQATLEQSMPSWIGTFERVSQNDGTD
jgi:hypothetical protein